MARIYLQIDESYGVWEAGYKIDVTKNKDGQPAIITGALYGKHVKVFADSMRAAAKQIGAAIYIGATLYQQAPASWEGNTVKTWNQGVLAQAGNTPDFLLYIIITPTTKRIHLFRIYWEQELKSLFT